MRLLNHNCQKQLRKEVRSNGSFLALQDRISSILCVINGYIVRSNHFLTDSKKKV